MKSFTANYDMEIKIQGRIHLGKLKDNDGKTSELEIRRLVQSVRQQSLFSRFSNHGLSLLLLGRRLINSSKISAGHIFLRY